ncbi:hypothetical protein [Immundisolibacter sp.]|uniref:hypothetical protein n=1 Tax=Immundisolibacter sp. TaxID=1934948 RepID=UPI00262C63FA|nr:hypothetical protein [Immundisolibacter sp.]MDD3650574.1 hypothetical protein [Immundisolibacter sp.]
MASSRCIANLPFWAPPKNPFLQFFEPPQTSAGQESLQRLATVATENTDIGARD